MMAFNPAAFNTAQLLAASQPTTPLKVDGLDGATADPMRYLAQLQLPIQGMPPVLGQPPFPFMFPAVQPDFKPEMLSMGGGPMPPFFLEAMSAYHPYAAGLDGARRKNATRETTLPLKNWLNEHRKNPYPTKGEKVMLAVVTKMTLTQVSTWFANARRRLKKENKMTWSPKHGQRDDDDDFGDIDANRPSSSASNISDAPGDLSADLSSNNNELKVGSASPMDAVRKPTKIWSIADTLVKDEEEENKKEVKDEAGSSNKAAHHLSEEPQLNFQQQMLAAMSRINPQMLSALRPGFPAAMFPHLHPQLLSLMSLAPQIPPVSSAALASAGLNGSFSSEAPSSVSPSSSHSDAKAEPCSPPAKSPASNNGSSN